MLYDPLAKGSAPFTQGASHTCIICGSSHSMLTVLSNHDRDHLAFKAENNMLSGPSQKKFSNPTYTILN